MDLIYMLRLLRRWLWLVALAAFIGGSAAFVSVTSRPPEYNAQVTIAIGNYLESPNPNVQEIRTGIDLAQTYSQLVRTFDVLNGVVEALELPFGTGRLSSLIQTRILTGTSLLQITVTYTDPVLAADIANELAQQLILKSPTNLTPAQQQQIELLNDQIESQTQELQSLREQLELLESNPQSEISGEAREFIVQQRNTLINQINEASANIAQFTNTIANFQQRTNSVEIVENARIPTSPVGSGVITSVLLGGMTAAFLAFGGVLLLEYFNDRLRTASEVTEVLQLPVLGVIARFGKRRDSYQQRLITNMTAFSQTVEEYRTLRTNLMYTSDDGKLIIAISSALPQEGKSVTASNLAVSMALSGMRVLLIDADMRRPRIHEIFGLENTSGLSALLTGQLSNPETPENGREPDTKPINSDEPNWENLIQRTQVPHLYVIPSGFSPPNPSELLGSMAMSKFVGKLLEFPRFDAVIFDTPPALAVADSAVLAGLLNAKVVLVVSANQTRAGSAVRAKERYSAVNAKVIGAVLNNADPREDDYYGYNYSYYYTNTRTNDRTPQTS